MCSLAIGMEAVVTLFRLCLMFLLRSVTDVLAKKVTVSQDAERRCTLIRAALSTLLKQSCLLI